MGVKKLLLSKFNACGKWFLRKKQSRGHGVHSPFAFDLITNVIHSSHSFYAYADIHETMQKNGLDTNSITKFNHLSYRLVHYFQPKKIVEINPGNAINTLFLNFPSPHLRFHCVEKEEAKMAEIRRLLKQLGRQCEIRTSLSDFESEQYDAIFVNLKGIPVPDIDVLAELSLPHTFWVFHPINKGPGKQFWDKIVQDVRIRTTFDAKETGIVFLHSTFYKKSYFV